MSVQYFARRSNVFGARYARCFSTVPKNPTWQANTCVNFCGQGSEVVVERFGRYHRTEHAGMFFAIPLVEKLHKIDMREMVISIDPQMAITRDNVRIELSGSLYLQFVDPYKALYGAVRPLIASVQQAQAIMRSCVGKMELDDIFHSRFRLNEDIRQGIYSASEAWGLKVNRYEVTDIVPDPQMAKAMDLQAAAERERRQQVRKAEADKEQTVLLSEAQRTRDENESEGIRTRLMNTAQGNASRVKLEAEAEAQKLLQIATADAEAIVKRAEAKAKELEIIAKTIASSERGFEALQYDLAKKYFESLSELGQGKGTVVVPSNLSDMAAIVATATKSLETIQPPKKGSGSN